MLLYIKLAIRVGSSSPIFYVNRKPMAILREVISLSLKMEHVTLHKLTCLLLKVT